jgi:hypothetical protein
MTVWFNNPSELFRKNKILMFWPTSGQSPDERINATTRFIIYSSCLLYLIKRDMRIFALAAMVIAGLFIMYKSNIIAKSSDPQPPFSTDYNFVPDCQLPSVDNPMANVLLTDYETDPNRPPACYYPTVKEGVKTFLDNTIPYDAGRSRSALPSVQRNAAARQFISAPVSTIPNAQTDFAEWCYGKKNRPMCKDDPSVCNPNARGVQLGAFAGLDPSGDLRTGMSRGGNGAPGTVS